MKNILTHSNTGWTFFFFPHCIDIPVCSSSSSFILFCKISCVCVFKMSKPSTMQIYSQYMNLIIMKKKKRLIFSDLMICWPCLRFIFIIIIINLLKIGRKWWYISNDDLGFWERERDIFFYYQILLPAKKNIFFNIINEYLVSFSSHLSFRNVNNCQNNFLFLLVRRYITWVYNICINNFMLILVAMRLLIILMMIIIIIVVFYSNIDDDEVGFNCYDDDDDERF